MAATLDPMKPLTFPVPDEPMKPFTFKGEEPVNLDQQTSEREHAARYWEDGPLGRGPYRPTDGARSPEVYEAMREREGYVRASNGGLPDSSPDDPATSAKPFSFK